MAVKKVASVVTEAVTAGADVTISDWRIESPDGVVKSAFKKLLVSRTLATGGKLQINPAIADSTISVAYSGDLIGEATAYATAEDYLDATFVDGDKLVWSEDGLTATARLAATAITYVAATA